MKARHEAECGRFGRLIVESSEKGLTVVTLEGVAKAKGTLPSSTLEGSGIKLRRMGAEELAGIAGKAKGPSMREGEGAEALSRRAAGLIAAFLSGDMARWAEIAALPVDGLALGAGFTGKVLALLRHVPPGRYITYGDLAEAAGSPKAARAAGSAMASNPLLIAVPCHRVFGGGGRFTGFGGGLGLKAELAALEQNS